MRRQTVHEHRMGRGFRHQGSIHLIRLEDLCALRRFVLLPHAGPGIGVHGVDATHCCVGIREKLNPRARVLRDLAGICDDLRIARVAHLRRRQA